VPSGWSASARLGAGVRFIRGRGIESYIINMARSRDRMDAMRDRFTVLGLPFERLPAVDGRTLSASQSEAFCRDRLLVNSGDSYTQGRRAWTPSSIGCLLRHHAAWTVAAESDQPYTAIFEDDLHVSADLVPILSDTRWIPKDCSIIRLEPAYNRIRSEDAAVGTVAGRSVRRVLSSRHDHCWPVYAGALTMSLDAAR
jgi:glycosyl transferase family 25